VLRAFGERKPGDSVVARVRSVHPVIDRRYGLDQIVEAYGYVETGQKIGNVLIDVAPLT